MADYTSDRSIDTLDDVSAAITSSSKIPCQDMNDTDRLGVVTPVDVFQAGCGDGNFCVPLYLNIAKIAINSKPSLDILGVTAGYSMPVYSNDDEELYFSRFIPVYWDGESDFEVHIRCHLQEANANKKFRFELCWQHLVVGEPVGTTCNQVYCEIDTGDAPQYQSFEMVFPIQYDIDGIGEEIGEHERIVMRLRRVAASSDEISGEVVVAPPCFSGTGRKVL